MPTMQQTFFERSRNLNDPRAVNRLQEFNLWLMGHARLIRRYHQPPEGYTGTTIEFTDGTAVTVLTQPETPAMELHRGKAHDRNRSSWVKINPVTPQSTAQLDIVHNLSHSHQDPKPLEA